MLSSEMVYIAYIMLTSAAMVETPHPSANSDLLQSCLGEASGNEVEVVAEKIKALAVSA
jgi:hypothetical protein